ncbi:AAA family ATPase [Allokutzneria sp. A3M-2-11 16]|uniref:AAA family ATPase n=1 Tax=Allokutzneria sp. A3M-2-11 16 TaxID=2962043 RepID=UPI0020B728F0|nr:LuxR family transcriptional regulator [Allokutzneria sp. A3M-2-11 16]MCP3803325.1 AAA family ATPase [Allokutzneria sp. A3M-2-11 16]
MLHDRATELETIEAALADVRAGQPRVLIIEGEPGIGKSALLDVLISDAYRYGMTVAAAAGYERERDRPFGVVRALFGPAWEPSLDPYGFVAAHGPLVIALDDGHWADPPSLDWLAHLIRRIEGLPVLVGIATRGDPLRESKRHRASQLLRPGPLTSAGVAALVTARLGEPAAEEFALACRTATGGNPLFLDELLRELVTARVRPTLDEAERIRDFGPDTIARHVRHRLDAREERVAEAIVVLGADADPEVIPGVANVPRAETAELLNRLSGMGILVHPITRTAVYNNLPSERRAELHRRSAQALLALHAPAAQVARHVMALGSGELDHAVDVLRTAASDAMAKAEPEAAAALLRRATEERLTPEEFQLVHLELGVAEQHFDGAAAVRDLTVAMIAATEPGSRAVVASRLAQTLAMSGRPAEAVTVIENATADGVDADRRWWLEAELVAIALLHKETRDFARHRLAAIADQAAATDFGTGVGGLAVSAMLAAHASWVTLDRPATIRLARRCMARGALFREPSITYVYGMLALARAGELDLAAAQLGEVLAHAQRTGTQVLYLAAAAFRSHVNHMRGRVQDALDDAHIAVKDTPRWRPSLPVRFAALVDALVERGELDAAMDTLAEAGLTGPLPDQMQIDIVLAARGRLRMARGDLEGALADFDQCGRLLARLGVVNPAVQPWRSEAAIVNQLLGRGPEAEELVTEELRLARQWGAPRCLGIALQAAGIIRGDVDLLSEAVSVLSGSGAELDAAKAHLELGRARARAGNLAEARKELKTALTLSQHCGATRVAEQSYQELIKAGAKPRTVAHTGISALTSAEWQVARLTASGMRNQDVAQTLFVTRRTVELHLTSIYRKLAVPGRAALTAALHQAEQRGDASDVSG